MCPCGGTIYEAVTSVTSCGNGDGSPGTGGRPETLSCEVPGWVGMIVTVDAHVPALVGENGWGRR